MAPTLKLSGSHNPRLTGLRVADTPTWLRLMIKALQDHQGDVAATARTLKIARATLNRWIQTHPELKQAIAYIRKESK